MFPVVLDVQSYPRVLLTHIPLYRQDEMYCGPNRKSPVINQVSIFLFLFLVEQLWFWLLIALSTLELTWVTFYAFLVQRISRTADGEIRYATLLFPCFLNINLKVHSLVVLVCDFCFTVFSNKQVPELCFGRDIWLLTGVDQTCKFSLLPITHSVHEHAALLQTLGRDRTILTTHVLWCRHVIKEHQPSCWRLGHLILRLYRSIFATI